MTEDKRACGLYVVTGLLTGSAPGVEAVVWAVDEAEAERAMRDFWKDERWYDELVSLTTKPAPPTAGGVVVWCWL